ncbi:uncharacterized protein LOC131854021 [Achroia grisella]|uniref:uncharacterized protein LOC131854021 n=1 Tax=Achroia grisella TaxID=688607 RepID=UPI0027D25775|nr:uncharacterized protein LOC131854021 [Achroia grisella]
MSTSNVVEEPKPLLLKKFQHILLNNKKVTVINSDNSEFLRNVKNISPLRSHLYTEDLIYESKQGDFLKCQDYSVTITSRHNVSTNSVRTFAKYVSRHGNNSYVKSSDNVVKLIGQDNYDVLFSTLCSVLNLEFKVRGILALQTVAKTSQEVGCQTDSATESVVRVSNTVSTSSQTDETSMDILLKPKQRKRVKRQHLMPYVVKDDPKVVEDVNNLMYKKVKKIVINPENFDQFQYNDKSNLDHSILSNETQTLPVFGQLALDEDSNTSTGNMSSLSVNTIPFLMEDPMSLLNNIERHTEMEPVDYNMSNVNAASVPVKISLLDNTQVTLPTKPEDHFHIATQDILRHMSPEHRRKLLFLQAYIDWKHCLDKDEDGYLPIHQAAQNGDVDLIRRQCLVLKTRQESVDITAGNMTALQISLYQPLAQCTSMLLHFGADPLVTDSENRTCFHLSAEEKSDHLRAIINYCHSNAIRIIKENEEFWKPQLENKSKEEQVQYLFDKLSRMNDNQGYTPLMLASRIGNYEAVKALLEMAPWSVNYQTPNSGDTALYLAVGAACMDASNRGNMTKVADNFVKTIEILIENGADPAIDNHSGNNVNILLTEFNIGELSLLIANKLTAINCFNGNIPQSKVNEAFILIRNKEGKLNVEEISRDSKDIRHDTKPTILENIKIGTKKLHNLTKSNVVINQLINETDKSTSSSNFTNKMKPETYQTRSDTNFMNTFKNFIKNNNVDTANIPITVEHSSNVLPKVETAASSSFTYISSPHVEKSSRKWNKLQNIHETPLGSTKLGGNINTNVIIELEPTQDKYYTNLSAQSTEPIVKRVIKPRKRNVRVLDSTPGPSEQVTGVIRHNLSETVTVLKRPMSTPKKDSKRLKLE